MSATGVMQIAVTPRSAQTLELPAEADQVPSVERGAANDVEIVPRLESLLDRPT